MPLPQYSFQKSSLLLSYILFCNNGISFIKPFERNYEEVPENEKGPQDNQLVGTKPEQHGHYPVRRQPSTSLEDQGCPENEVQEGVIVAFETMEETEDRVCEYDAEFGEKPECKCIRG